MFTDEAGHKITSRLRADAEALDRARIGTRAPCAGQCSMGETRLVIGRLRVQVPLPAPLARAQPGTSHHGWRALAVLHIHIRSTTDRSGRDPAPPPSAAARQAASERRDAE